MNFSAVRSTRRQLLASSVITAIGAPALVRAQDRPLKIVVGYPPGGGSDIVARLIAERLRTIYGVVMVENKPGAGGRMAAQQVAQSKSTDRTVLLGNPAVMVVAPLVVKDLPYNPEKDFVPLSQLSTSPFALISGPSAPVKAASHLFAWMHANQKEANVGVPATGSLPHFVALMLNYMNPQLNMNVVGYNGSAPMLNDLLGGQIPAAIDVLSTVVPHHQSGKARVLAVSGKTRSPFLPDVPSFKEAGIPAHAEGFEIMFAPASMPADEARKLAAALTQVTRDEATQKKLMDLKINPVSSSQEVTRAFLNEYRAFWHPIIKRSGFKVT